MNGAPIPSNNKLQTGIELLSAYSLGERFVFSEKFLEECTNAVSIEDPLMKLCWAARSVGIDAVVQEVYTLRSYIDRDEVWLIEKGDRMILLDTPVWQTSFRIFDSVSGVKVVKRKHLAHFLDFSIPSIPYRALILDRASLRKWADTNPRQVLSETRRWVVKNSGWMSLIGVILMFIYIIIYK